MRPTELAWLEQGGRVAWAVLPTDAETKAGMLRYMTWRWGAPAMLRTLAEGWIRSVR